MSSMVPYGSKTGRSCSEVRCIGSCHVSANVRTPGWGLGKALAGLESAGQSPQGSSAHSSGSTEDARAAGIGPVLAGSTSEARAEAGGAVTDVGRKLLRASPACHATAERSLYPWGALAMLGRCRRPGGRAPRTWPTKSLYGVCSTSSPILVAAAQGQAQVTGASTQA